MTMYARLTAVLMCLTLAGCATGPVVVPNAVRKQSLTLISQGGTLQLPILEACNSGDAAGSDGCADEQKDRSIAAACGARVSAGEKAMPAGLVFLQGMVGLVLDHASTALEKEVAAYTVMYDGSTRVTDFYLPGGRLKYSCLHFTAVKQQNGQQEPTLDLIARIVGNSEAMYIQPLRLYFRESATQKSNTTFGIAGTVSASSVWKTGSEGHKEQLFLEPLFKAKVDLKKHPKGGVFYFQDAFEPGTSLGLGEPKLVDGIHDIAMVHAALPWPSFSSNVDKDKPFGTVEFSVAITEVGEPPEGIKNLAALFKVQKPGIADALKKAVAELEQ